MANGNSPSQQNQTTSTPNTNSANTSNNQQTANQQTTEFKLDNFEKLASISLKLSIAAGFLIVFIYCFFKINWFPIGLSLADTVGFIMLALGFAALIFAVELPIFMGVVAIIEKNSQNNRSKNHFFKSKIIFAVISAFFTVIAVGMITKNAISAILFILIYLISTIVIAILSCSDLRKDAIYPYFLIFLIIFIIITMLSIFDEFIMTNLGIRRPNSIIQLSENDYKLIKTKAEQCHLTLSGDEKNNSLSNVKILWRGMGSYTLIELDEKCKNEKVRMEIKTDESKIIYTVKDSSKDNANKTASEPKINQFDENNCKTDSKSKLQSTSESQKLTASEPVSLTLQVKEHPSNVGKRKRCHAK